MYEVSNALQSCQNLTACLDDIATHLFPISWTEKMILDEWIALRNLSHVPEAPVAADTPVGERVPRRIRGCLSKACSLMTEAYSEHWTLERLSKRSACNRTQLEEAFQLVFGVTIHEYLTRRRIERAKLLLKLTCWRIEAVAKEVGYSSKVSLYSNFKKVVGLTPEEYRKRWELHDWNR